MHSYKPQKESMMIYGNTIKDIIKMYFQNGFGQEIFFALLSVYG